MQEQATPVGGELRRKLVWLLALRAIIVTFLLGTAVLVQLNAPGALPTDSFLFLIGLTYALTVFYAVTVNQATRRRWLIDLQLACDAVIVSAIILITGGVTSYFSSLYVLPIVAANVVQSRRGGLMVAMLSAILYGGIVLAQYEGLMSDLGDWAAPPTAMPLGRVALYTVGLNVFGFLVVAVLSGYLAEGLLRAGASLERASNQIADLQAFSQHVIDSLTSGLVTTDSNRRILTFNRAAETITGHAGASAVGVDVADILQLVPEFTAALEREFDGQRSRRVDYEYITADGRRIDLGLSAAPLITATGQAGCLLTFQDVTEGRRLEREVRMQQRLAAVGEMAAGIAHEIRNPLASMSGSIQILRQELDLTDDQAQLMDIVLRESDRLNDTIRSFLAYARPQRLAIVRIDLANLLHDTAMLLRNSSEYGEEHRIVVDAPDGEVWYDADEGQIRQILWNLATNGLRAMPRGGTLTLTAAIEPDSQGGMGGNDGVILAVQDAGVGIASSELDKIFQPFRGAFSRGTGLGLAIVHRIVSDYSGEIQVTSELGKGTTVRIRFPLAAIARAT